MKTEIQSFFRQQWLDLKKDTFSLAILCVGLVVLSGYGIWKGKAWYIARKEGAAQLVFSDAYGEYQQALNALADKEHPEKVAQAWKDADISLQSVQETQAGSIYSFYAQALRADVLIHEEKYDEAVALLEEATAKMRTTTQGYYLYKTKQALILFDAGKADQAVALLKELADDNLNEQNDTAAFYLGSYYWSTEEYDKAKDAWKLFTEPVDKTNLEKVSPWTQVVETKLAQLS